MFDYHKTRREDIVRVLKPLFDAGKLKADRDTGKITINNQLSVSSPWIHVVQLKDTACNYFWEICFHLFGYIHSRCMNCYKVVARPETLEQLMALVEIQKEINHPCKCGIEDRLEVPANYGGYWYCKGIDEGLDMLDTVREAVKPIGIASVFLKRGCTEFENHFGDSRKWEKKKSEKAFEEYVDDLFELDPFHVQPEYSKQHIQCLWTEFAWSRGDMTCTKYIGGPLYPPYVTYERNENEAKD